MNASEGDGVAEEWKGKWAGAGHEVEREITLFAREGRQGAVTRHTRRGGKEARQSLVSLEVKRLKPHHGATRNHGISYGNITLNNARH